MRERDPWGMKGRPDPDANGPPNNYRVRGGHGCICGKRMLMRANDGTCLWCGHGKAVLVTEFAYELNMRGNQAPMLDARVVPSSNGNGQLTPWQRRRLQQSGPGTLPCTSEWPEDECIIAARRWENEYGRLPMVKDWQHQNGGPPHPTYAQIHRRFGGWRGFLKAVAEVPREQVAA